MLLKGEALIGSITLGFSIHGERGDWKVTVNAPGSIASECETGEPDPWALLDEMMVAAINAFSRKFPQRAPVRPTR